jgi:hypothetical protein
VVVHYFDIKGSDARPHEANAPLVVDANAVLTLSVTLEYLKTITWRSFQKVQSLGCLQLSHLALCDLQESFEFPRALAFVQRLRVLALERLDHASIVLRGASYRKMRRVILPIVIGLFVL